jgi:hypothetical protein
MKKKFFSTFAFRFGIGFGIVLLFRLCLIRFWILGCLCDDECLRFVWVLWFEKEIWDFGSVSLYFSVTRVIVPFAVIVLPFLIPTLQISDLGNKIRSNYGHWRTIPLLIFALICVWLSCVGLYWWVGLNWILSLSPFVFFA